MRRILLACDKFKGSLGAEEANAAIARGLRRVFPQAEMENLPIADGGEGFVKAMAAVLPGRMVEMAAHDSLGREIVARYWLTDDSVVVMEMAEASGFWRIAPDDRDILRANTFGTGEMIRHAAEVSRARKIVIGLGGSATNDGGAGMAAALGVCFQNSVGSELDPFPGAFVGRLAACDFSKLMDLPPITAACDVTNPLLGPRGATRVFGPQKGADETTIPKLEDALERLVEASGGGADAVFPGSGAAGGIGFGLMRFGGASLEPGFSMVADLVGLEKQIAGADLVITGEGSLDAQSLDGKGPCGVAMLARKHGKPVWAFCGVADDAARGSGLFERIFSLAESGLPLDMLMRDAAELLEKSAGVVPP